MRIFFDTEFIDDGKTIDLISIGMIREDEESLYLVSSEFDMLYAKSNDWLRVNVLSHIPAGHPTNPRHQIAEIIRDFTFGLEPEFWAYYADYDWVALCQLFGPMIDLPEHWPKYCRDLKQLADECGAILPKQTASTEHHALADARWVMDSYRYCQQLRKVVIQSSPAGGTIL